MSRLEQLLEELCPSGVEYKQLGDVCEFVKGKGLSKKVKGLGEIPIILYGELYTTYENYITRVVSFTSEDQITSSPIINKGDLVLPVSSTTKEAQIGKASVFMVEQPAYLGGDAILLKHNQNPGYLVYLLNGHWFEQLKMKCVFGTTINHLHPNKLANIQIPIPPLPVQEEIVRILDTFTTLEAELEKELEARAKQYEYYRDALLNLSNCRMQRFGEIATIVRGASPRPIISYITKDKDGVNWIKIGDVTPGSKYITSTSEKITQDGSRKSRFVRPGDFVLSNSMSFGRPYILKIEGCIHDGWLSISDFMDTFTPDFLYHLLSSNKVQMEMAQRASKGTVQNLNADIVKSLELPVPSLPVQEEIVAILDRFDALVNDLKNGLPAEIAARRKQYEYYRDQLLTFKPLP